MKGFNDDGVRLAEQLDIKYMDYDDALEQILADQSVEEYLAGNALLSVTVVCDNEAKNSEMLEHVESCTASRSSVSCHSRQHGGDARRSRSRTLIRKVQGIS